MNRTARRVRLSLGAAILLAAPAGAQTFGYTGSIVTWTAPTTGTYFIDAIGAMGGNGFQPHGWVGGRGAEIGGRFSFSAGDMFRLAVGGKGASSGGNGGGGGGSFFMSFLGSPLLIAGGGGGIRTEANRNGCDASLTGYGIAGSVNGCATKTSGLGAGGVVSQSSYGAGGAGVYSDGADDYGTGGRSWANGLAGGTGSWCGSADGGFGGGGSGMGCYGGGGGGGYSGGDGGSIAGGGGSFNDGSDAVAYAGKGVGDGSITITADVTGTPEPASMVLLGTGLVGVFGLARRKRSTSAA